MHVADVSQNPTAVLQPGQQATLLLELEQDVSFGRDAQIKLTTAQWCCICWNCRSWTTKWITPPFFHFYEK